MVARHEMALTLCVGTRKIDIGLNKMTNKTTNKTDWHRLFGITLIDYFRDSNYRVELEKDLSLQQQYLDVIIIEQAQGQKLDELPDGLDNLRQHNLLSYKSHQEALDTWALDELLGHYVNYRKQESPPPKPPKKKKTLLPETDFQLYAVSTRYPHKLAKEYPLETIQDGVYKLPWGSKVVRVIVLSRIPKTQKNTVWQLFSSVLEKFEFAKNHHDWRNPKLSSIINQLYEHYCAEGVFMSYTIEDYLRETEQRVLNSFTLEEIVKKRSREEVVKAFTSQEVLKSLPIEVIEEYLSKVKQKQ
ncbi:hypothetical protein THIOM_003756 [Candidatus Thiomargarita nelsonii]|uniref:Uncharacterized protein n=1 Tax=Candidatus Thiomargarita nelsonii TaxID=1003181 RepID=A0A0A6NXZ7_9GAMM|nr:hypothetical protein THIOM_003756 [Candidatus Thiomargarita nelsonii]